MASFPMVNIFGIALAILAGGVCVVWIVFPFIAMSNLRRIRQELEKRNQAPADPAGKTPTIRSQPVARVVPTARVVSPPSVVPLKISKQGRAPSLRDTSSIKVMLQSGELTLKDRYFDRKKNEWVTLDCHPEINQ